MIEFCISEHEEQAIKKNRESGSQPGAQLQFEEASF